jgi:Fic family protein
MLPDLSQSVWSDVIQDMDSIAWSLAQAEQARRELDQLNTGLTPSEKARHEDVRKSLDDTIEALTKQADDLYQATLHAVETQQIAGNNNIEPNLERIEKAIGSLSQTKAQALPFLNEYTNVLEQQLVEETDVRPALPESN